MKRRSYAIGKEIGYFSSLRAYAAEIMLALRGCDSVLDVGCGHSSLLRYYPCKRLVGVDVYKHDLDLAREAGTHDEYVLADIRTIGGKFSPREFDACVSVDVIEHLTSAEGLDLLKTLESLASRTVIVCTPNQFLPQSTCEDGDSQAHLSGWSPRQMEELGYSVFGALGSKCLRTRLHRLRFKPVLFWALCSWVSHRLWCRNHPESAAAMVCVKNLSR